MKFAFAGIMLALLAFTGIQICHAGFGSGLDVLPTKPGLTPYPDGIDIDLDLGNGKVYNTKIYKDALVFLDELRGASSCHRLAAHTLINVCQSIDNAPSIDVALAEVKEEYAAKLAACELNAVHGKGKDVIPKVCKMFLPAKDACPKTRSEPNKLCYAPVTRIQVTACISALHERAQQWTSYSNSLQNIQNACQASRLSIDRDQMLDQIKEVLEMAADASRTTQEAVDHIRTQAHADLIQLQELQKANHVAVERDMKEMVDDMTAYGRQTYLSMLTDMAKHYFNWTSTASHQADVLIEKNELVILTAEIVQESINEILALSAGLATEHDDLQQQIATISRKIINDHARIHAQAELTAAVGEAIHEALAQQIKQLAKASRYTNEFNQIASNMTAQAHELTTALTPATTTLRFLTGLPMHDVLIFTCVVFSGFIALITCIYFGILGMISLGAWLITVGALGLTISVLVYMDVPMSCVLSQMLQILSFFQCTMASPSFWLAILAAGVVTRIGAYRCFQYTQSKLAAFFSSASTPSPTPVNSPATARSQETAAAPALRKPKTSTNTYGISRRGSRSSTAPAGQTLDWH